MVHYVWWKTQYFLLDYIIILIQAVFYFFMLPITGLQLLGSQKFMILYQAWLYTSPVCSENWFILICLGGGFWTRISGSASCCATNWVPLACLVSFCLAVMHYHPYSPLIFTTINVTSFTSIPYLSNSEYCSQKCS